MSDYRAIEAFARGAMTALLAGSEGGGGSAPQPRPRRRHRSARGTPTLAVPTPPPQPQQMPLMDAGGPIAPGAGADDTMPASITQAQAEAMERVLRGEMPVGYYRPAEGVAPWMES